MLPRVNEVYLRNGDFLTWAQVQALDISAATEIYSEEVALTMIHNYTGLPSPKLEKMQGIVLGVTNKTYSIFFRDGEGKYFLTLTKLPPQAIPAMVDNVSRAN